MKTVTFAKGTDLFHLPAGYQPKERLLESDELSQLKPYLIHITRENDFKGAQLCIRNHGDRAAFTCEENGFLAHAALITLQKACDVFISTKVMVPEFRGRAERLLQHRIFQFEIQEEGMIVKYTTVGAPNHFETAMLKIQSLYPEVPIDEEKNPEDIQENLPDAQKENVNA